MSGSIKVQSPADGRMVATVPDTTPAEVSDAARALRTHQPAWQQLGPAGRAAVLRDLRDWILDNNEHLTTVLQSESGKAWAEAELEGPVVAEVINYFAANAAKFLADQHPKASGLLSSHKRLSVVHRPYPVVGVITPWNFPLMMPGIDVVPALLAGAAVLLKPSEVTPLSAVELARGWQEIGAPPVFTVATGAAETGQAVVETADFVQFTGSTATGRLVAHAAIDRNIPYSLETGGKDPAIVLADADLERAVAGVAWGALFNSGQACVAIERVYVEAPVYDEFVARLTDQVTRLRQGPDDISHRTDIGAMATQAQHDIVESHVAQALAAGARALTGGRGTADGRFYPPTILVDVHHSMACIREETFGPTIPIIKVADADDAVRQANDSRYGLSATIWTRNYARGEQIARQLEVGAVNINDAFTNLLACSIPHAGWKSSGTGARFGGAHGMRKYTRQQAITTPRIPIVYPEPLWYPYSRRKSGIVARALRFIAARGLRRRTGM